MAKKFQITVSVIDERLLESPVTQWFDCDLVVPLGIGIVRQFNSSECIVAREAYLFSHDGHRYGTFQVNTMDEFLAYRNSECIPVIEGCCYITYAGCYLTFNGKKIVYNGV